MGNVESKLLRQDEVTVTIPFTISKSAEETGDRSLIIEPTDELYWEDDEYFFEMCKAAFQFALLQAFKADTGVFLKEACLVSDDALGGINSAVFYRSEGGYFVSHNKSFYRLAKRLENELRLATDMILSGAQRKVLYFEMIVGRCRSAVKRSKDIQQYLIKRKENPIPIRARLQEPPPPYVAAVAV